MKIRSSISTRFPVLWLIGLLSLLLMAACAPIQLPSGAPEPAAEGEAVATEAPAAELLPIPGEIYNGLPVGFTPEGFPFRGDPNAPVTMVEYSDFQCPFCARYFVQTEPAINDSFVR